MSNQVYVPPCDCVSICCILRGASTIDCQYIVAHFGSGLCSWQLAEDPLPVLRFTAPCSSSRGASAGGVGACIAAQLQALAAAVLLSPQLCCWALLSGAGLPACAVLRQRSCCCCRCHPPGGSFDSVAGQCQCIYCASERQCMQCC